jgi:hypothetical protein
VRAAAAVLAASLIFFLGVLTGVGRREAVPPPAAITLGAVDGPAASDVPERPPPDAPQGTVTTATSVAPAPVTPPSTGEPTGPGGTTGATATTVTTATTGPATTGTATTGAPAATRPASTTTTRPEDVEEVDGQVNCRSQGKGTGKREPCPSTTTATGEAPGGGRNNR